MLKIIAILNPALKSISLTVVISIYKNFLLFLGNCKTQKASCPEGHICFFNHEKKMAQMIHKEKYGNLKNAMFYRRHYWKKAQKTLLKILRNDYQGRVCLSVCHVFD